MANSDVIEFECPRCQSNIRVANSKSGARMDCPTCQGTLLVPDASAGPGLFEDIFDSNNSNRRSESQDIPGQQVDSQPPTSIEIADSEVSKSDNGLELDLEQGDDLLAGIEIPASTGREGDVNPLEGIDPFEVDENAPLKIDGVGDLFENADVYGIKCKVCDTRIHVRPDQTGKQVECPECYTKILVPPNEKPKHSQRWVRENHDRKASPQQDDELKLGAPVELPARKIDETYGLEAPEDDLLAPQRDPGTLSGRSDSTQLGSEDDRLETIDSESEGDPKIAGRPLSPTRKSKRKLSRRELYEESQRRQSASESDSVFHSDGSPGSVQADFPSFDFGTLLAASIDMLKSPGVVWRSLIGIFLLSLGTIVMQWYFPDSGQASANGEDQTMLEHLALWAAWGVLGGIPYLFGVIALWFTSAYVYRDAALGHRHVMSWKNAGRSELTGTFLIFGFGFFIGGLPAFFLTLVTLPLRVLFGPLLLLGAWYSQGAFSIVNVDAFKNVKKDWAHWMAFYKFMLVLALAGFVAGLIFWLRALIPGTAFALTVIVSIFGVIVMAVVTLMFAAVCGWHCGKVVEGLETSA